MVFLLISKCTRESIGYGDSWLILLLGIQLGYLKAISVLFAASLLAGVASLFSVETQLETGYVVAVRAIFKHLLSGGDAVMKECGKLYN